MLNSKTIHGSKGSPPNSNMVKLERFSKDHTSVFGLGVDFVFPLSQKQDDKEEPKQNIPEGNVICSANIDNKSNQVITIPFL